MRSGRLLAGGWDRQVRRGPSRGFGFRNGCSNGMSPSRGRPSQGSPASRSAPHGVAATSVRRPLRVRFHDHEVFRRPAVRRSEDRRRLPRLGGPLRVRAVTPSPAMPGRVAPPGVSRPFSDVSGGIRITRVCLTRHVPSSRFLAASTGSSPSGLADSLGPLPLLGFSLFQPFREDGPWCVAAPAAPSRLRCSTTSNSEECEDGSSAGSKALEPLHPGPTAVVPEPESPLRSTSPPDRRRGFRLRSPPHAPHSPHLGEPWCFEPGAAGFSTDPEAIGSARDPRLPWGSRCIGRRSGASRCSTPPGTGIPVGAVGRGGLPPRRRTPRFPAPHVPTSSPDFQRAICRGQQSRRFRPACPTGKKAYSAPRLQSTRVFIDIRCPQSMWITC